MMYKFNDYAEDYVLPAPTRPPRDPLTIVERDTAIMPQPDQVYLWKLSIENFKRLQKVQISLNHSSIFVGPSGTGKTSALQALKFWHTAISKFHRNKYLKEPTVILEREDLDFLGLVNLSHCWTNGATRRTSKRNKLLEVPIEISVSVLWNGGVHLVTVTGYYLSVNAIECEIHLPESCSDTLLEKIAGRGMHLLSTNESIVPQEQLLSRIALDDVQLHQKNLSVLRNKLFWLSYQHTGPAMWTEIKHLMSKIFLTRLGDVGFDETNGALQLRYSDESADNLELVSASRAVHQFLGLMINIAFYRDSWILIDGPETAIEQHRLIPLYRRLRRIAEQANVEYIIATQSSDFVYNTSNNESITSFIGNPHQFPLRRKREMRMELNAFRISELQIHGWILFLEGQSDLEILRAFAHKMNHPVARYLQDAPTKFIGNGVPSCARQYKLFKLTVPDLRAVALFDRNPTGLTADSEFEYLIWTRKEIENYLLNEEALILYCQDFVTRHVPEISSDEARNLMQLYIEECIPEGVTREFEDPHWNNVKVSDEFLCPLFAKFFNVVAPGYYARNHKAIFAQIVPFLPDDAISPEINYVLDRILVTARGSQVD